ncbi:MAG TPA: hypothetical protein VNK43_11690 [Gemmatimonadales bacterium]|nr:hypothetical protein [Gemmatimonadales bacterium]
MPLPPVRRDRRWPVPAALTLALALALAVPASPISDPTGAALPDGVRLRVPPLHLLLAPLFDLWDAVSMLGTRRLAAFFLATLGYYVVWRVHRVWRDRRRARKGAPPGRRRGVRSLPAPLREAVLAVAALAGLLAFVLLGALWHRPMVALAGVPDDLMVVDVHAHTNASHDVRNSLMRKFDAEALRRWHRRAGFDATFVTDHNTVAGLAGVRSVGETWLCPGIEVSAWRAHILLLGDTRPVDRGPYSRSLDGLLALLRDSEARYGAISVASIPEYERNHWTNLDRFVAAGVDGFEIVNASPKANELGRARRDSVIALARAHDLLVLGASDSHGWGATSMVWNLVRVPGWRTSGVGACARLVAALRDGGFETVQVVERHRLRADTRWPLWLTPIGAVWETWRGLDPARAASWLVWIWGLGLILRRPSRAGGAA